MTSDNATMNGTTSIFAERTVHASPQEVFALLADPARHHLTEPRDWVRGSLEGQPVPITEVDQVFGMEMFNTHRGGRYEMHNRITVLEPDRAIAWAPGQRTPDGEIVAGGWFWRYDLESVADGTRVRLTYDWAETPLETIELIGGMPAVSERYLGKSLASLAAAVESGES
ncbi:SRPBCC family protein [Brevibacterium sp. R8603A2]|uniref:SRPBCC family protein n=1 Tax=Brevibacterium sp. R8603A2 TaxID=2929779 RepID=UPI001FF9042E|nr:SRPBCC family protein [Brevibacterium sp. R8603A2]MCK1803467.1 SRPBCC family protein [Brevibacterium sp. R8603A2]